MKTKGAKKRPINLPIKLKYLILGSVNLMIIGLHQVTKILIVKNFRLGESYSILDDFFNLTYVHNQGAAFGMFAHSDPAFRVPFFLIVPFIALFSIGSIFWKLPDREVKFSIALSLVIAGAIGNLIDRLSLGYVVDFLDFHWYGQAHFATFNIADSAICVGVGLLMLDLFTQNKTKSKKGTL